MKLQARCRSCKGTIKVKSFAATRPDLEMNKGEEFSFYSKCNITFQIN